MRTKTGYVSLRYANSLSHLGSSIYLPGAGGYILKRAIGKSQYMDGIGCYPLFCCRNWRKLGADLAALGQELVTVALVADPFGEYDKGSLQSCFDIVREFKDHYIADLRAPMESILSPHHRRSVRKALQEVDTEICEKPSRYREDWICLYRSMVDNKGIQGIADLPPDTLSQQLGVPGLVMIRASQNDQTIGMTLWYIMGDAAYYHLGAFNSRGYKLRASFALFWKAFEHFKQANLKRVYLGGPAGLQQSDRDGLARFKDGWSTHAQPALFCGRICDPNRYRELCKARGLENTTYFPSYRAWKF